MHSKFRAKIVAVIVLLSSLNVEALDFQPGYIVLSSNDTIWGLVEFAKSNSSYRVCQFKKSADDETVKYKPTEINGYGFQYNKVFVAQTIQGKDGSEERVFLNLVNSGVLKLYQSEDAFYLRKDDHGLHKLSNEAVESVVNGTVILKQTNRHIAILNMLMADYPQLQTGIKRLSLDEESLTRLVVEYNKFKGVPVTIYKDREAPPKPSNFSAQDVLLREATDGYNHYEYLWSVRKSAAYPQDRVALSPRMADTHTGFNFLGGYVSADANNPMYTLVNPFYPTSRNYFSLTSNPSNRSFALGRLSTYMHAGFSDNQLQSDFTTNEPPTAVESFYQNPFLAGNGNVGYWGGVGITKPFTSLSTYFELRYEQANGVPMSMPGYWAPIGSNVTSVQVVLGFRRR